MAEQRNFIFILLPACNIVNTPNKFKVVSVELAGSGDPTYPVAPKPFSLGTRACNLRDRLLYRCNGATLRRQGALRHRQYIYQPSIYLPGNRVSSIPISSTDQICRTNHDRVSWIGIFRESIYVLHVRKTKFHFHFVSCL